MDVQTALETSIKYERDIRNHYARGSKEIRDPHGRRAFEVLAREEQEHLAFLQKCLRLWKKNSSLPQSFPSSSLGNVESWLDRARAELGQQTRPADAREVVLLKAAIELEARTASLYEELVANLPEEHQSLFQKFLETERGHGLIVQAELDALSGLGFWFGIQEFRNPGM